MGELARRARLAKQTMTTMVRLLERDGLVRRESDPEDGRASLIFLTERSRSFRPVAEHALRELEQLVTKSLGAERARDLVIDLKEVADL